jgi:hypothetical protein
LSAHLFLHTVEARDPFQQFSRHGSRPVFMQIEDLAQGTLSPANLSTKQQWIADLARNEAIITREEIEAICRRHLANVREAAKELLRCAKRYGALDDRLQADTERRCAALEQALAEGRCREVQKQAPLVIGFFANEIEEIRSRALAAAQAARSKRLRIAAAATTLISAMESAGRTAPSSLRDIVARADFASDQEFAAMQSIIQQNHSSFTASRDTGGLSQVGQQLAKRLADDEYSISYGDWLAQNGAMNQRDERLASLLAEIDTFDDTSVAQPFLDRVASIKTETSPGRWALLIDSLVLELAERSRQRKSEMVLADKLRAMRATLSTLGVAEARAMELEISAMLESSIYDHAEAALDRAAALIDRETAKLAAAARRNAVLQGLAELGYEVGSTMATAWARDGRLIVRKPGTSDYGVELGAPSDLARLQVRLVASWSTRRRD